MASHSAHAGEFVQSPSVFVNTSSLGSVFQLLSLDGEPAALCPLGTAGCRVIEKGQMTNLIVSREKEGILEPTGSCCISSI